MLEKYQQVEVMEETLWMQKRMNSEKSAERFYWRRSFWRGVKKILFLKQKRKNKYSIVWLHCWRDGDGRSVHSQKRMWKDGCRKRKNIRSGKCNGAFQHRKLHPSWCCWGSNANQTASKLQLNWTNLKDIREKGMQQHWTKQKAEESSNSCSRNNYTLWCCWDKKISPTSKQLDLKNRKKILYPWEKSWIYHRSTEKRKTVVHGRKMCEFYPELFCHIQCYFQIFAFFKR